MRGACFLRLVERRGCRARTRSAILARRSVSELTRTLPEFLRKPLVALHAVSALEEDAEVVAAAWIAKLARAVVVHETVEIHVPTGKIGAGSYVEKDTSWYEFITGTNAGAGDAGVVQPEGDWDGSATCPSTLKRVYGNTGWAGIAYGDYQLHCDRSYTFYRGSVTDPILAAQVDHFEWQFTSATGTSGGFAWGGDAAGVSCGGPSYCVGAATVRAVNADRTPLAISDPIVVSGGTSPSPFRAPNAARAPSPGSGSATRGARREVAP
jgi:hypothetical protein